MKLINIRNPSEEVTFEEAVLLGSASGGGLFMPKTLPLLKNVDSLLELSFQDRSIEILSALIGDEFGRDEIERAVMQAFSFPLPLRRIEESIFSLELFHGPTLAFKDFGARFMAQIFNLILARRRSRKKITILTATSGDTGAAVAHAFFNIPNIDVRILYPGGLITSLQEKLFCTMGGNVRTFRVTGRFDDCQSMVKSAFTDDRLVRCLGLTSANSINFCRLLAQILYYFEGAAALRIMTGAKTPKPVVCVPSGNFGNLTAGIFAQRLGLPVSRFIAATNANKIVPRFLSGEEYAPRPSIATLANAMDVGAPNNWERIVHLFGGDIACLRKELFGDGMTDEEIRDILRILWAHGFLSEPHSAVGYGVLKRNLQPGETGVYLSTAHPAKFKEIVEETLGVNLELPSPLAAVKDFPIRSEDIPPDASLLKARLLEKQTC